MAASRRLEETEELAVLRLSRRLGSHRELRVDLATFAAVVAGGSAAVAILNQATAAVAIALIGLAVTVVTVRQRSPWLRTANDLTSLSLSDDDLDACFSVACRVGRGQNGSKSEAMLDSVTLLVPGRRWRARDVPTVSFRVQEPEGRGWRILAFDRPPSRPDPAKVGADGHPGIGTPAAVPWRLDPSWRQLVALSWIRMRPFVGTVVLEPLPKSRRRRRYWTIRYHRAEPGGRGDTTSFRLRSTGLYREATVSRRSILILVSDLHLTGETRPSPHEHDPSFAFTQFVEDLRRQLANAGSRIRLVVLGDMLDITRLEARIPPGGAVAASIQRLESIANAHAQLFQALGRFVSAGGELDVVIGNHDLDLAHPKVQERFIGRLGVLSGDPGATRVTFHRWFLYIRDVAYAEHGHRYHDINAVPVPGGSDVPGVHTPAGVPLAAYLESYRKAVSARGSWRMLARELATLTGSLVAWTAQRPRRMAGTSPADDSRLRDAADTGLDANAILAIDALSAHLGAETALRVGRTILGPPVRLVLPYGAAAGVLALALRGTSLVGPTVTRASDAALTRLIRNRRHLWPPPRSTGYALEAAQHLRRALESAGCAVPFYVLGHTHVPTLVALDRPGKPATYLNTGSWTAADRGGRGYPFVRISRIETGHPDAELLWWQPHAPS
jgi:UDP-2,3-diacylglucosamine pyrophosphatase LpxH